jgi:GNAT superfamily N-acetyltransferase
VRLLSPSDSMEEITAMLHRAYRAQVEMGLRPLAGRQDAQTTRRRCASGECYVAVLRAPGVVAPPALNGSSNGAANGHAGKNGTTFAQDGEDRGTERIVGTILFHEVEDAEGPPWFKRPDVDSFSQFAVDPDVQGRGIGRLLLETAERRAAARGSRELGLSMAEPDTALMEFYVRRGYRLIEPWQWPYTNYRSAILSKTLV